MELVWGKYPGGDANSVKPLGAGPYKYTDPKSGGILSFKAVQFMRPSFRELVGNDMFETLRCLFEVLSFTPRLAWNLLCSPELMPVSSQPTGS